MTGTFARTKVIPLAPPYAMGLILMVVLSLPVTVIFAMLVSVLTRKERSAGNDHA